MDHYIDFRILPDPEFKVPTLLNALFAKFHWAVTDLNGRQFGVSFPHYHNSSPHLGDCLRVHAGAQNLVHLMSMNWLAGMRDHLSHGSVETVPVGVPHCRVRRVQPRSSAERLRRRCIKRHG
ncbi:MAG: type I-F CRISPR-associated endoribonuclease Cas6/Csy4, partial [Proteobacteria bacterium]|nr:type I-F CRISPR-associated endoribonuclease Cas6/Csy4 [Pseudomonadota bacterium]